VRSDRANLRDNGLFLFDFLLSICTNECDVSLCIPINIDPILKDITGDSCIPKDEEDDEEEEEKGKKKLAFAGIPRARCSRAEIIGIELHLLK
jgi:hypothetical protein